MIVVPARLEAHVLFAASTVNNIDSCLQLRMLDFYGGEYQEGTHPVSDGSDTVGGER